MRRSFDAAAAVAALLLFGLNEHQMKASGLTFFTGYLNDILAGLFLLAVANGLACGTRAERFVASLAGAAAMLAAASAACELLLPMVTRSHGDPLDALAYFTGGAVYLMLARVLRRRGPAR